MALIFSHLHDGLSYRVKTHHGRDAPLTGIPTRAKSVGVPGGGPMITVCRLNHSPTGQRPVGSPWAVAPCFTDDGDGEIRGFDPDRDLKSRKRRG
jgi:hypothetical protein